MPNDMFRYSDNRDTEDVIGVITDFFKRQQAMTAFKVHQDEDKLHKELSKLNNMLKDE